jgi:hypothetical protein
MKKLDKKLLILLLLLALFFFIVIFYYLFKCIKIEKFEDKKEERKNIKVIQINKYGDEELAKLTKDVNEMMCDYLGLEYNFVDIDKKYYSNKMHPLTSKILYIRDLLDDSEENDIIIILHSDAWIENPHYTKNMIEKLLNSTKNGCFSREPYVANNTYINSGSFILKVNDYTKNMFDTLIKDLEHDPTYLGTEPFDQYYISNFVYKNTDKFYIFKPLVLNTPLGLVFKNNWNNRKNMNDYLKRKLDNGVRVEHLKQFKFEVMYDTEIYPNPKEEREYHYDNFYDDGMSF